mmetsp:Transcript_33963/g.44814  ORF Transcript_33963/g.44814 Transcript_33963/m.44814 type:complete len:267 (+) Transcript_33963:190-990(+)
MVETSNRFVNRCQSGKDCEFFKKGICKFYHSDDDQSKKCLRNEDSKAFHIERPTRDCKYGQKCKYLKDGRCRFRHDENDLKFQNASNSLSDIIFINSSGLEKISSKPVTKICVGDASTTQQLQEIPSSNRNSQKKVSFQAWPRNIMIPCKEEIVESASEALWWTDDDYRFFREREEFNVGEEDEIECDIFDEICVQEDIPLYFDNLPNCEEKVYDLWGVNNPQSFSLFANSLFSPKASPVPCFDEVKRIPSYNGFGASSFLGMRTD